MKKLRTKLGNWRTYFFSIALLIVYMSAFCAAKEKTETKGQQLYGSNCQVCHRQGRNPIKPENMLSESSKLASRSMFKEFISSKHGLMPQFRELASVDSDLKELYKYVKTLKYQSWEYQQQEPKPDDLPMKDLPPAKDAS